MKTIRIWSAICAMMIALLFAGCSQKDTPAKDAPAAAEETPGKASASEASQKKDADPSKPTETSASPKSEKIDPDAPKLSAPPKRVIAGTVAIAEILDMLGFDDVVGVPQSSYALPARYQKAAVIGRPMEPDIEKVVAANPDFFLSVSSLKDANLPKLEAHGIPSYFAPTDSYDDLMRSIATIGELVGKRDEARAFIARQDEVVSRITAAHADHPAPKVLFLFGSPKSILVGTKSSYVGSLLAKLGVKNAADDFDLKGHYAPVNTEEIAKANPDIILRMMPVQPEVSKKMLDKEFSENDIWKSLPAVQAGKVYDLDPAIFGISGNIRVESAFTTLAELLYR